MCRSVAANLSAFLWLVGTFAMGQEANFRSHSPMRPLPTVAITPMTAGPKYFVDVKQGNDRNDGKQTTPWKTLQHALRHLRPGDTLYLRAGTYYEHPYLTKSGTAESPITIAGFPGEKVVIDGGVQEIFENPQNSWQPLKDGAEGEYVSTAIFPHVDDRQVPHQFLPAAWEPMWGLEEQRPIALGNFGDSLVPLHGYRTLADLRATNEFWPGNKNDRDSPVYCGPGLWFNRETGRVHIRLAHNTLPGLGGRAYQGEQDPRKLPLIVALGFGRDVFRIQGVQHVCLRDLILRGATGSPLLHVYGAENVELDHLTLYGGFPALLVNASKNLRVVHSAFRGLAAPWTGRSHMKYRGTASYQVVLQNNQPMNENLEFAWCEFTDDHDCAFLRYAKNLHFHHNYVDNFNDDGLECGPKLRNHTLYIYQNRIGACLGTFQQHQLEKDESPIDHDSKAGVFIFRNVIDSRAGVYYHLPSKPEPDGDFLHSEGALVGDHGGPTWPVIRFYHNTVLRRTPVFRDYFLFGLGVQGTRNSERDVFNNLLVQMNEVPGVGVAGLKEAGHIREGGNILWGVKQGPSLTGEHFAKFRASPLFAQSKKFVEAGWTMQDKVANPLFTSLSAEETRADNLQLQAKSPAIDAGLTLPNDWMDTLRATDSGQPDIGAIPLGTTPDGVGVQGRISLYRTEEAK